MADNVSIELSGEMETPKSSPKRFPKLMSIVDPSALIALISAQKQAIRPWLLFVQTSNFKVPTTLPRLSKRVVRNLEYFRSNYLFVSLALFIYCLVTSPILLLVICTSLFISYKFWKNPMTLKIGSYQIATGHQCVLVALCCLPFVLWAGAGAALFWVIGASITVIGLHAAFYNVEGIVTEDSEDQFQLVESV